MRVLYPHLARIRRCRRQSIEGTANAQVYSGVYLTLVLNEPGVPSCAHLAHKRRPGPVQLEVFDRPTVSQSPIRITSIVSQLVHTTGTL